MSQSSSADQIETARQIVEWLRGEEGETVRLIAEMDEVAPEDALAHAIEERWVWRLPLSRETGSDA